MRREPEVTWTLLTLPDAFPVFLAATAAVPADPTALPACATSASGAAGPLPAPAACFFARPIAACSIRHVAALDELKVAERGRKSNEQRQTPVELGEMRQNSVRINGRRPYSTKIPPYSPQLRRYKRRR